MTLATSTGLPWLVLAFHVATGLVALAAGFVAIATPKGGTWHRRSGLVFVWAMVASGVGATAVAMFEGRANTGGVLMVYLVITAWTAVRPLREHARSVSVVLMVVAFALAAWGFVGGFAALGRPGNRIEGVPAGMIFFMATVTLLAAVGDARTFRTGPLQGSRRIARHLWRMSFALFIASGSFFLGQMKFIPEPIRFVPLIVLLAIGPLLLLLYWMWRVRLRQNLRGLLTTKPIAARGPA